MRHAIPARGQARPDRAAAASPPARASPQPARARPEHRSRAHNPRFSALALQTKLKVGRSDDPLEREADRVADVVMRDHGASVRRICSGCAEEQATVRRQSVEDEEPDELVQRDAAAGPAGGALTPGLARQVQATRRGGEPLSSDVRAIFEPRLGRDLSEVRIHRDATAADAASALSARAYTVGADITFARGQYQPDTPGGRRLLAHEITHFAQQQASAAPVIRRQVAPENVASEMVGRGFEVAGAFSAGAIALSGGETVIVVSWSNTATTARVELPPPNIQAGTPFDIPKTLLRPIRAATPGVAPYSAGIAQQVAAVQRGERRLASERARAGGPRPGEIPRLEGLQKKRQEVLNRRLIQETMFNRFDGVIKTWTDHYNTQFGFTGGKALNPNLVKSMLFQESQMGTSGQHLEVAPSWKVRSRFNVAQVIDSAAAALLIMMAEMQPALITTYHLARIDADRVQAQRDFRRLSRAAHRTPAEDVRLAELHAIDARARADGLSFAETFMWQYKAPGELRGFDDAVADFFASVPASQPHRDVDYEFWIRTAIRWLFEKRRSVSSWDEAIRAYNGSGARARHYRDAVTGRAKSATQAQKAGQEFVPSRI